MHPCFAPPAFHAVLHISVQVHILLKSKLMNDEHFSILTFFEKKNYTPPALPKILNSQGFIEVEIKESASYSEFGQVGVWS